MGILNKIQKNKNKKNIHHADGFLPCNIADLILLL